MPDSAGMKTYAGSKKKPAKVKKSPKVTPKRKSS